MVRPVALLKLLIAMIVVRSHLQFAYLAAPQNFSRLIALHVAILILNFLNVLVVRALIVQNVPLAKQVIS
jgi:hypothetical protein